MRKKEKNGFPGGIHPTDGYDKALTMDIPVREFWPDQVTVLTEQSFGGKCGLQVKPNDQVKAGELIGYRKLLWQPLCMPVSVVRSLR